MERARTVVLAIGIAAVSTASIFVRLAQQCTPSLAIAAARLVLSALALAPFALARQGAELRRLRGRDLGIGLLAGAFLALHFWTWVSSLEHTTVVSSVVLVTTSPVWVALLSGRILGEAVGPRTAGGLALAVFGGLLVASAVPGGFSGMTHGAALSGDLLAIAGAWMMAGYLLAGRSLRARLPLLSYVFVVYSMAAAVLLAACAAAGKSPLQGLRGSWPWLLLLAAIPQLLGHSIFNWALRRLPAAAVSVALLGEPVGSALLAYCFLGESPKGRELAGAALILAGIAAAIRHPGPGTEAGL